jgi:copper(I)-binding protein
LQFLERGAAGNGVKQMKKIVKWISIAVLLLGVAACQRDTGPQEPELEGAWIRGMPGMKMTAAYGRLTNVTSRPIELVAYASNGFEDVSLHRTVVEDGVSRMESVERLVLQPGETLDMKPGGYHLMLMAPKVRMASGVLVSLELTAADGRVFVYEVPIERR